MTNHRAFPLKCKDTKPAACTYSPSLRRLTMLSSYLSNAKRLGLAAIFGACACLSAGLSPAHAQTLTISPSSLQLPQTEVAGSSTGAFYITNHGASAAVLQSFHVSGNGFVVMVLPRVHTIQPGRTLHVRVDFRPQATGDYHETLTVTPASNSSTNSVLSLPVAGTATGTQSGSLAVTPSALSFGTQNVGTSATKTITLTAGSRAVTVSHFALSGAPFALVSAPSWLTLQARQSVTVKVSADPTAAGTQSGQLTFNTTTSTPVFKVGLSVVGAANADAQRGARVEIRRRPRLCPSRDTWFCGLPARRGRLCNWMRRP